MGDRTGIEWTDATWNPVTGCSKVSQGCKLCYAERDFHRPYPGRDFTDVRMHPERLDQPRRWKAGRMIFVNSMSDLFHEKVSREFLCEVFSVMGEAKQHNFQVLTKRPERMLGFLLDLKAFAGNLPKNVWLGVSVEDQATADERIPLLLQTPAAVRFISYEPALGPVDLTRIDYRLRLRGFLKKFLAVTEGADETAATEFAFRQCPEGNLGERTSVLNVLSGGWFDGWDTGKDGRKLDWIIAGGESGPQARPAHPDWFRSVRDQCQAAGVPFFFKQWGEAIPVHRIENGEEVDRKDAVCGVALDGTIVTPDCCSLTFEDVRTSDNVWLMRRVGKASAGRLLDGREWSEFPAFNREVEALA